MSPELNRMGLFRLSYSSMAAGIMPFCSVLYSLMLSEVSHQAIIMDAGELVRMPGTAGLGGFWLV